MTPDPTPSIMPVAHYSPGAPHWPCVIESPFRGESQKDQEANIDYLQRCIREALDDADSVERERGIVAGIQMSGSIHPEIESVEFDQTRAPTHEDITHDVTHAVVDHLADWVRELDGLTTHDGGPELPYDPQPGPIYDALTDAVNAYLREHLELADAAWQPTGRVLVVRRDGTWEVTL